MQLSWSLTCPPPPQELAITAGDYLYVFGEMDDDGFYFAQLMSGENGMVPSNFVEKIDEGEEGEVVEEGERQERERGRERREKEEGEREEGKRKWWEIHVGGGKKREVREGEERMIECVVNII